MMDMNSYLGDRERRSTNQRRCWSMTSFRRPIRAVDKIIKCCYRSVLRTFGDKVTCLWS